MRKGFVNFIKSVIIGACVLIPGVSGGSMAIALGIYDRLLRAVARFGEDKKQNFCFLFVFIVGAMVGAFAFSGYVLSFFEIFKLPMVYFFMGCVFGSIPMLFRRGKVKSIRIREVLWVLGGYLCVIGVSKIPTGLCTGFGVNYIYEFMMLFAAGVIISAAFILPGISTSYIFLILGIYDSWFVALKNANVYFFIPIILGICVGTVIMARILAQAIQKYKNQTYMLIVGFLLGTVFEIIPTLPNGKECFLCIAALAGGFLITKLILRYTEQR